MPTRPRAPCTTPGCGEITPNGGRCARCRTRKRSDSDRTRGTSAQRGYGNRWQRSVRPDYLTRHPRCALCGKASTVPDHYPRSRRELVAAGVPNPDVDEHLRPLCDPCHRGETARRQPGGWHRERAKPPDTEVRRHRQG
jgi:5-methylcytosine-specific restriction protein A